MNRISKPFCILTAIAMLALSGCGGPQSDTTAPPVDTERERTPEPAGEKETTPTGECAAWAGTYLLASDNTSKLVLSADCSVTENGGHAYAKTSLDADAVPAGLDGNRTVAGAYMLNLQPTDYGTVNLYALYPKDTPMDYADEPMTDLATDRLVSFAGGPPVGSPYDLVRENTYFREFIPGTVEE